MENLTIQVSILIFNLAKEGKIRSITAHLDPVANKELLEGKRPETVSVKAKGTRRSAVTYRVKASDVLLRGYQVKSTDGLLVATLSERTGRVVIGEIVEKEKAAADDQATDPS